MNHLKSDFRIGAVSYLNTKPLVHRLDEFAPDARIEFDLPSRLADRLADGELDIALIPTVEYFRNDYYTVVSDACIACRGPVWSVKLFSRVPIAKIRTLSLDEGSRTSAAMTRSILAESFGIEPELRRLPIGDQLGSAETDAVLLIGDRAMKADETGFEEVWDLGEVWCRSTELPFVFAMWTARPGFSEMELSSLDSVLTQARDAGVANLESIAKRECDIFDLTHDECVGYLRDNLHFRLGTKEREGLKLFYERTSQLGLVPKERELKFHDCQTH